MNEKPKKEPAKRIVRVSFMKPVNLGSVGAGADWTAKETFGYSVTEGKDELVFTNKTIEISVPRHNVAYIRRELINE